MARQTARLPAQCVGDSSQQSACAHCIVDRLKTRAGIRDVQVQFNGDTATVELDYDSSIVPMSELEREFARAGLCLDAPHTHLIVPIDGMYSQMTEQMVEAVLNRLPGVRAHASYVGHLVRIEFNRALCPLPAMIDRIEQLGLKLRFDQARRFGSAQEAQHAELKAVEQARREVGQTSNRPRWMQWITKHPDVVLTALGGGLVLAASIVHWSDGPQWLRLVLVAGAFVTGGWYTAIDTFKTLAALRFDIDVLMFAAAFGAAALGHYEEGALLLFLFALGTTGEHLAMERARGAIRALTQLTPSTAMRRNADGSQREVQVEELAVDDVIVVPPGQRIAADGVVIEGASAVDQSPITGESMPVEKVAGDEVFAGTINGEGMVHVRLTRRTTDTTLARIIRLVTEAQTTRSPTQMFTDRVEKWYVPLVLVGTACVAVVPPLAMGGEWAVWFYRSMAFLTGASPCALALGTPAAVLCGIARAARGGVLVKGGAHLENLGRVRAVAFDKTGTLTRGRAQVCEVAVLTDGVKGDEMLALAAAVERQVRHPLALAIVAEARARNLAIAEAQEVEQITGKGLRGRVDGRTVAVGKLAMVDAGRVTGEMAEREAAMRAAGQTAAVVVVDGEPMGLIGLADRARDNAAGALEQLRRIGVRHVAMLTGDHPGAAEAVAKEVGVNAFHASLLPEQKVDVVRAMARQHGPVAMVGDGVNDAPALAAATVGIAMGTAGTDVAMETADVALMGDDLGKLAEAVALSRFSRRVITQNLVIALGVIAVLAPTAALGGATLTAAVIFHEGSTVVVVLNALRLLGFRMKK